MNGWYKIIYDYKYMSQLAQEAMRLATGWTIPGAGGVEIFLQSIVSILVLGSTQPPKNEYRRLSPGVKAAERRTSHPTSP